MPYSVSPHRKRAQLQTEHIEAEIELLALHAAGLRDQKVPQLVNEDHRTQADRYLAISPQLCQSVIQLAAANSVRAAIKCIPNVPSPCGPAVRLESTHQV